MKVDTIRHHTHEARFVEEHTLVLTDVLPVFKAAR